MTDENTGTDAEGVDWGQMEPPETAAAWTPDTAPAPAAYPEHGPLPEARISINFKVTGEPMITVRGHTAQEITEAFNEMEAAGVYANIAAAMASLRAQGQIGAGLGPVSPAGPPQAPSGPPVPPQGMPQVGPPAQQSPGPPPFGPNVSAPQAPGYQGPPPQQGGWSAPPQQQGGWGGQQQRGNGPAERPAGWLMVDVPYNDKDRFKALRANAGDYLKGKVRWGGKGVYWLEPSVAQWIAQQGFPVTQ